MFPSPIWRASRPTQAAHAAALLLLTALWLLPLLGVAMTSVRSIDDLNRGNYWGWPSEVRPWANYATVLFSSDMSRFILNSFIITIPSVLGTVIFSTMTGYALAKHRLKGSTVLLAAFIGGNLVPFQILAIPVRSLMADALGLYDSRQALILFHVSFQTGFATLFMRNFIRQLPDALIDTARVEGLSEWQILVYVVVPLVRPAMAAVAVLVFTFVWNDYFWALILAHSNEVRPITVGLQNLRGMWVTSWHLISAAALLAAVPPAFVFFVMQQHFIAGLTTGVTGD